MGNNKLKEDFVKTLVQSKDDDDFLMHHGILGQKWGVRRYQNKDGSLTPAGLRRYNKQLNKSVKHFGRMAWKNEDYQKAFSKFFTRAQINALGLRQLDQSPDFDTNKYRKYLKDVGKELTPYVKDVIDKAKKIYDDSKDSSKYSASKHDIIQGLYLSDQQTMIKVTEHLNPGLASYMPEILSAVTDLNFDD